MNEDNDLRGFSAEESPGLRIRAVRWLREKVMKVAMEQPRGFSARQSE